MEQDDEFDPTDTEEYVNGDEIALTAIRRQEHDEPKNHAKPFPETAFPPYSRIDNADGISQTEDLNEMDERDNDVSKRIDGVMDRLKNMGGSKIDYILSYNEANDNAERLEMRRSYEKNLGTLGMILHSEKSTLDDLTYIKIFTPFEVLCRGAQLFKIKKPIIHQDIDMDDGVTSCSSCCKSNKVEDNNYIIAQVFDVRKKEKFDIKNEETFFTDAERSYITLCLLRKSEYKYKDRIQRGIDCLLNERAYVGAFPLHDPLPDEPFQVAADSNDRIQLRNNWSSIKCIFSKQPLDQIRRYLGEKSAFYFAWLGVYTVFLIPASLFGIASFIYGLATFTEATKETCDVNISNYYVCPKCNVLCDYTLFSDSCSVAKFTTVFDNEFTPAVAFFICLWGIMFDEFWKRKQNWQMTRWHVTDFEEDENVRPEFVSRVQTMRKNKFTGEDEPYLSFFNRTLRFTVSISIILFLICVVIISIFGILVYRLAIVYALYKYGDDDDNAIKHNAKIITTVTSAIINVIAITVLGLIYTVIARLLTELEAHRTQSAYEDSFTFKIIIFQFINYYGSLIYIAFFKGSFVDRPGHSNLLMFKEYRQDECSESGCFYELTIQLIIIMIGKQLISAIIEMSIPALKRCWNYRKNDKSNYKQWEKNNNLSPQDKIPMFSEYLEMVMQYGFLIMFVAAFPLAPLFALINNLFEIRLDALKAISLVRRCPGIKAQDIGAWQYIITYFTYIGIATNAFIIAWTSEFIPKCVYRWHKNDRSLHGYNDWSMATFDVTKMTNTSSYSKPNSKLFPFTVNITECRYRTFSVPAFELTTEYDAIYWHILCARWAFVIVFEHIFIFIMALIQTIPDENAEVRKKKKVPTATLR